VALRLREDRRKRLSAFGVGVGAMSASASASALGGGTNTMNGWYLTGMIRTSRFETQQRTPVSSRRGAPILMLRPARYSQTVSYAAHKKEG